MQSGPDNLEVYQKVVVPCVEQAHTIFYMLQDYSSLTLVERREGWVLEVIVVVGEQETG